MQKKNMAYFDNYMSEDLLNDLGYVRLDYGEYGRKMVKDIRVVINGYEVETDFVVVDYVNKGEPLIVFGRSFLKLDEVMMGRARLENKDHSEEDRERILEKGLPKKQCNPGNFVLPVCANGTIHLDALADTEASISVLPYLLYKNLGLGNPRPYHSNLTMADNTQAKAMGKVRNVRIQIGYQAYLANFLVLDIPVDKELPLLLGQPFLRTCGAMIDMGRVQ
ncbi:DNA-directed DNA polymerase [Tanacetum coccineum]